MTLELSVWRGTDTTVRIQVFQRNDTTPQDMTGWALAFTVRIGAADADPASIVKTTAAGITIGSADTTLGETAGTNSVAIVTLSDDDTTPLTPQLYACDLKRTDAGSEAILAAGPFQLLQEVTR
jgi:hypothetical protein